MNLAKFALVLFLPAVAMPRATDQYFVDRSIRIAPISSSQRGLPEVDLWDALAKVGARVEASLKQNDMTDVMSKADRAIQGVYEGVGHPVRVEHEMIQTPPGHGIEIKFRIIELCACD